MNNAKGGEPLDFKTNNIDERPEGTTELQHKYRGSVLGDGRIASARDVGNMSAGIVSGRNGLSWKQARVGFDALQTKQRGFMSFLKYGPSTEPKVSVGAQREGYQIGLQLRRQDQASSNNERP